MAENRTPGIRHLAPSRRFPNGGWLVRYRDDENRTLRQTFKTQQDALDFQAKVRTDKNRGDFINPRKARTTFREVAEDWYGTMVSLKPKSRVGYRQILDKHLLPKLGSYAVSRINRATIKRLLADLATAGAKPGTQRNILRVLSPVMAHAVDSDMIRVNPCAGVSVARAHRQEMRFLEPEQVHQLAVQIGAQYRTLVLTAAYTGMRAGELAALRVRNVDLLKGRITVAESVAEIAGELHYGSPKNGRERSFSIPRALVDLLMEQAAGKGQGDLVFTGPHGAPLRHGNYYGRHFKRAVGDLVDSGTWPEKLRGLRFHDLRHTAAAILIDQGEHPKAISDRLGHSSIGITMDLYGHRFPSQEEKIAERLDETFTKAAAIEAVEVPEADVVQLR